MADELAEVWEHERESPYKHELSAARITAVFVEYLRYGAVMYESTSDCMGGGGDLQGVSILGHVSDYEMLRIAVHGCRELEGTARWFETRGKVQRGWGHLEYGGQSGWTLVDGGDIPVTSLELGYV